MTKELFWELLRQTLTDPRAAGARVIEMKFPLQGLWIALGLVSVVLSLLVSGILQVVPLPPDEYGEALRMAPAYQSPLMFALLNWGQAVISVFVLYWIGQVFGGRGTLADMLSVMIWLQVVSLVLALGLFFVGFIFPIVGGLAMLLAVFWGLWATVALVDAANRFDNMFKAAGVCLVAVVAYTIGMTMLSVIVGGFSARGV